MGGLGGGGVLGGVPVGTSRYGEFTFVENCRSTPLLPPVGNTIQPLFVRVPASHAATEEVTSILCQPVFPRTAPTPPMLVELHDDAANGRLVHVTVACRTQGGAERDTPAERVLSQSATCGCEGSVRLRGRRAHMVPGNGELAE
jgi:hypothetical protein